MSPILSSSAMRETPQVGKGMYSMNTPQSMKDLLQIFSIKKAKEEIVKDPAIDVDDALANKLPMDTETLRDVLALLKAIPLLAKVTEKTRPHFDEFLRDDSPPPNLPELDILPIFPRSEHPGLGPEHKESAKPPQTMSQLPISLLTTVQMGEDDEEDLADEHLVVVNGWQAYRSSSPSCHGTPSLADSSSEIDELFMPSSPASGLFHPDRFLMEEYQLPKCERIGGARHKRPLPVQESSDDSIGFAIKTVERACGDNVSSEDPACLILQEKLEEKDGLLMDVPVMRSPNEHSNSDVVLPTRLADLLAPSKSQIDKDGVEQANPSEASRFPGCLKRAKGLQPLQIELSWIPFKYGRTVPTDEEVADVQNDPCPQLAKSIDLTQEVIVSQLSALLDKSMAFGSQPVNSGAVPSTLAWSSDGGNDETEADLFHLREEHVLILPRRDRRRLACLSELLQSPEVVGEDLSPCSGDGIVKTREHNPGSGDMGRGRPPKRVRFHQSELDESSNVSLSDTVDDSGVFIAVEGSARPTDFGQSTCQVAKGPEEFERQRTDGDLLTDIRPMHPRDYYWHLDHVSETVILDTSHQREEANFILPSSCASPAFHTSVTRDGSVRAADPCLLEAGYHDRRSHLPLTCPLAASPNRASVVGSVGAAQNCTALGSEKTKDADYRPLTMDDKLSALSVRRSLAHFLAFCGKASLSESSHSLQSSLPRPDKSSPPYPEHDIRHTLSRPKGAPPELIDDRTLRLPGGYVRPNILHIYMASMDLIQRRALVRTLASSYAVELVERERLSLRSQDLHLILDCDTAVFFASVEALPIRGDALVASLTESSWRFNRLLLVFECYPSSWSYKGDKDLTDREIANVWSSPVVKAVKKLRRDLSIAEGVEAKPLATTIEYAFANTVEEAAAFTRLFGDLVQARADVPKSTWEEREWLTHDERDGEFDLSGVQGMNLFAASLLLSHTTLEDFLEMSSHERVLQYGQLVGMDRITQFNIYMTRRLEAIQLPPSSPVNWDISSSSDTIPHDGDIDIENKALNLQGD
ncbi:hypothetical protein BD414DRAFT_410707 [Trametes punicea]|nr:hypothetical protein BD414DRAFT_410707 [Trametes punicea]